VPTSKGGEGRDGEREGRTGEGRGGEGRGGEGRTTFRNVPAPLHLIRDNCTQPA